MERATTEMETEAETDQSAGYHEGKSLNKFVIFLIGQGDKCSITKSVLQMYNAQEANRSYMSLKIQNNAGRFLGQFEKAGTTLWQRS